MATTKRKRKPEQRRYENTFSFGADPELSQGILGYLAADAKLDNLAAALRHLVRRGLEAEKEAARG